MFPDLSCSLASHITKGTPGPNGRTLVKKPRLIPDAMGLVRQIAIFVLALSFTTFVAFFGRLPVFRYRTLLLPTPENFADARCCRHTPIGFLHRLIWIHIPNGLAAVDKYVTDGRLGSSLSRTGHYLMHEKHPIVLVCAAFDFLGSSCLPVFHTRDFALPFSVSRVGIKEFSIPESAARSFGGGFRSSSQWLLSWTDGVYLHVFSPQLLQVNTQYTANPNPPDRSSSSSFSSSQNSSSSCPPSPSSPPPSLPFQPCTSTTSSSP